MAVHIIHVSKTGGTAVRYAVRTERLACGGKLMTPWGPLWAQLHKFRLRDVPEGHKAIITLRDPISRFLSGFWSRKRKGAPRHFREWSDLERRSFEWFSTPQELADALAGSDAAARKRAVLTMRSIQHLKWRQTLWTGKPTYFTRNLDKVLYVARQETLDDDWENLKELLGLRKDLTLPHDEVGAHRTAYPDESTLSSAGVDALRAWYADDCEILEIGECIRQGRKPPPSRRSRLQSRIERLSEAV